MMKTAIRLILLALCVSFVTRAGAESNTVSLAAQPLISYLESELSYPNEEKVELKIEKIKNQMKLLDPVTNADSPQVWQYRHDKLEYLIGCLYLEMGDKKQAYRHLKTCMWNCGRYDIHARRVLELKFKDEEDSNKPDAGDGK
jgi:hypothetical protein